MEAKFTNQLIKETSPYLLQHAHNPVNWIAWSNEVYELAKQENKLILISVGYSSCHWCHVMEHECFENEEVAEVMNKYFICVKVDREERPDIDQIYMTAVQLMTQRGGWPLNCFTLPDGRPIYGGTYFPKDQWIYILNSLQHTWEKDSQKAIEYAEKLHEGISHKDWLVNTLEDVEFSSERLHEMVVRWSRNFDNVDGGYDHAPKFPMPNNYLFLLRYGFQMDDQKVLKHVEITLDKMAMGGIYDQIGGGFSRYSVDHIWKVPHFEKMLYDNGQLLSLYAQAYKLFKKPLYKQIIEQTIEWLDREMLHPEGSYFSALDADSEGEEGKFYCWTLDELDELLQEDFPWVADYYNIGRAGYWEEDKNILLRNQSDAEFAKKMNWDEVTLRSKIEATQKTLLTEREKRIRPGLDDKCLTSWNALLLKGLVDSYSALDDSRFLDRAKSIANWLVNFQLKDGKLLRTRKNGISSIPAFLEDYATAIDAFISLYQATFSLEYLATAKELMHFCLEEFIDNETDLFFFTDKNCQLISRKIEMNDNVIPASNSIMANNLFLLGKFFHKQDWIDLSRKMLSKVYDGMEKYGSNYSNWASLLLNFTEPFFEVSLSGLQIEKEQNEMISKYQPNILLAGGSEETIPMLEGKIKTEETTFNICSNDACFVPVFTIHDALQQLNSK